MEIKKVWAMYFIGNRPLQGFPIKAFLIKDHIRFDDAAAGVATRNADMGSHIGSVKKFVAFLALITLKLINTIVTISSNFFMVFLIFAIQLLYGG